MTLASPFMASILSLELFQGLGDLVCPVKRDVDFPTERSIPVGNGGKRLGAGEGDAGVGDDAADQRKAGAALRPRAERAEAATRRHRAARISRERASRRPPRSAPWTARCTSR